MDYKDKLERLVRWLIVDRFSRLNAFEKEKFIRQSAMVLAEEAESRNLDDKSRHYLLYRIQRALLPHFVIADHGRLLEEDEAFRKVFEKFSSDNWTSFERKWNLREFLKMTDDIPGDYAECGVYRGGSAYLLCEHARSAGKHVYLFDSFEGLSDPQPHESHHWTKGDLSSSEALLRANLAEHENYSIHAGWIPECFQGVESHVFSFVHVDVDLEQPTRDSIEFFFPRMSEGGILLLDDHGYATCPGARAAALDYFKDRPEIVLDLATGQGLVIKRSGSEENRAQPAVL